MEEDILIAEEFIKYYEAEAISRKFRGTLSISVDEDDIQAIENLIKGYREKESRYNNLKSRYNGTKEALRVSQELEKHYSVEASELEQQLFDSIPKSKIREKIEELEKIDERKISDSTYISINGKIAVLQELLEDK